MALRGSFMLSVPPRVVLHEGAAWIPSFVRVRRRWERCHLCNGEVERIVADDGGLAGGRHVSGCWPASRTRRNRLASDIILRARNNPNNKPPITNCHTDISMYGCARARVRLRLWSYVRARVFVSEIPHFEVTNFEEKAMIKKRVIEGKLEMLHCIRCDLINSRARCHPSRECTGYHPKTKWDTMYQHCSQCDYPRRSQGWHQRGIPTPRDLSTADTFGEYHSPTTTTPPPTTTTPIIIIIISKGVIRD